MSQNNAPQTCTNESNATKSNSRGSTPSTAQCLTISSVHCARSCLAHNCIVPKPETNPTGTTITTMGEAVSSLLQQRARWTLCATAWDRTSWLSATTASYSKGQDSFLNLQAIANPDIIHRHVFYLKHDVSETGFCLRLRAETTQLGPTDRASPRLRRHWCCYWCPKTEIIGPTEWIPTDDGEWIQFPKRVSNKRQEDGYARNCDIQLSLILSRSSIQFAGGGGINCLNTDPKTSF
jgi:hypothetical protein